MARADFGPEPFRFLRDLAEHDDRRAESDRTAAPLMEWLTRAVGLPW